MTSPASSWGSGLLVITAWGLAFSLSAHLTSTHLEQGSTPELADLLLGESRQVLSLNLFNEADLYFHKGAAHLEATLQPPGPFRRWQTAIIPDQHAHTEGDGSAEILPWLKLATRADPHNVEAFLVASFWASSGLQRQDLAFDILNEAQRLNPGDYRIPLEKGRLAIVSHHFDEALSPLDSALTLHTHTPSTPARAHELALDRAEILTFLAFLNEIQGHRPAAIHYFKTALSLFPERTFIKERIDLLEAGTEPLDTAQSLLERITRKTTDDACKDTTHNHAHDESDHDH